MKKFLYTFLISLCSCSVLKAQINEVPQEYSSIQEAIDSSESGDTVLVSYGYYQENLFIDKALTLMSTYAISEDPHSIDSTVIDGGALTSCIRIEDVSFGDVSIVGFTIENGNGHFFNDEIETGNLEMKHGGGFFVKDVAHLSLEYLKVRNNHVTDSDPGFGDNTNGGGLFAINSFLSIDHCLFMNNQVHSSSFMGKGAGLCLMECHAEVNDSRFEGNFCPENSYAEGGGIFARNSHLVIGESEFEGNYSNQSGAIGVNKSDLIINHSSFTSNSSWAHGSVLTCQGHYLTSNNLQISNCTFDSNISPEYNVRGALYLIKMNGSIEETEITNNQSGKDGGGLNISQSNLEIRDCNISSNSAIHGGSSSPEGGGLTVWNSNIDFIHVNFQDNTAINDDGTFGDGGALAISNSEIMMDGCTIEQNISKHGGGVWAIGSTIKIHKSLFALNMATEGGAISSLNDSLQIISSTIAENEAELGSGILSGNDFSLIANTILWNENGDDFRQNESYDASTLAMAFSNCHPYGIDENVFQVIDEQNLSMEPHFMDAENANFDLTSDSPMIDSGINQLDYNGQNIFVYTMNDYHGSMPDIGCFEAEGNVGLEDYEKETFRLYPVPVNTVLFWDSNEVVKSLEVYDFTGRLVISKSQIRSCDMSQLKAGHYTLRIEDVSGKDHVQQIVKIN